MTHTITAALASSDCRATANCGYKSPANAVGQRFGEGLYQDKPESALGLLNAIRSRLEAANGAVTF